MLRDSADRAMVEMISHASATSWASGSSPSSSRQRRSPRHCGRSASTTGRATASPSPSPSTRDRQLLQVVEGRHPGSEVVQREGAAERLQCLHEAARGVEIQDRARLRHLEADALRRNAELGERRFQEAQEGLVADRRAGRVDRATGDRLGAGRRRALLQAAEGIADDPKRSAAGRKLVGGTIRSDSSRRRSRISTWRPDASCSFSSTISCA